MTDDGLILFIKPIKLTVLLCVIYGCKCKKLAPFCLILYNVVVR